MKHRSKLALCAVIICLAAVLLAACSGGATSKSYTFTVETGEDIEVTYDTTGGYGFTTNDGYMVITDKDGAQLLEGFFVLPDYYEEYINDEHLLGSLTHSGEPYRYASDDYGTVIFLTKPTGGKSGVLFYSDENADFDACVEAFERISFEVK